MRIALRILVNDFVRGIDLSNSKPYTCIFDSDEDGDWIGTKDDWDWELSSCDENTTKQINEIILNTTINNNPAKDVKIAV